MKLIRIKYTVSNSPRHESYETISNSVTKVDEREYTIVVGNPLDERSAIAWFKESNLDDPNFKILSVVDVSGVNAIYQRPLFGT